ncbi:hypothetical protein [Actinacidiphila acidipaludis]|uniref:Uncharacterized protein n=1 Tax=Actinacidiphila acidipaludis TaxID=2873382 RepID=A0ABS7QC07_9ACTN|nr:hypothetical protein [Streptomyces acidipaludis]MBY8880366.1 hypothetical protein [Streptomyces acidipaludis]
MALPHAVALPAPPPGSPRRPRPPEWTGDRVDVPLLSVSALRAARGDG